MRADYESISGKYNAILAENQELLKKVREKEKLAQYLEKEVERRTGEFKDMVFAGLLDFNI